MGWQGSVEYEEKLVFLGKRRLTPICQQAKAALHSADWKKVVTSQRS